MRAKTLSQSTLLFHGQYCWTQRGFTDTITKLEQTDNVRRKALLFIYTTYKQRACLTVISDQEGDLGHQHVSMDALFTQNISFPSFLLIQVAACISLTGNKLLTQYYSIKYKQIVMPVNPKLKRFVDLSFLVLCLLCSVYSVYRKEEYKCVLF